jgi:hypothetical protein
MFSVRYNFPLKLDLPQAAREHLHQDHQEPPKTDRKIKNNYVICKDNGLQKKDTIIFSHKHSHSTHL